MVEPMDYRLALILPETCQLLGVSISGILELPRVSVPAGQRETPLLTQLIEERWKIRTVVLDCLWDSSSHMYCAVVEVRTSSWHFSDHGFLPVQIDMLSHHVLGQRVRASLASILAGGDGGRGAFSRIGWLEEARRWIRATVGHQYSPLNDDLLQLNAGGRFALLRFSTNGGPRCWLKATGEPNAHEFNVTMTLAHRNPEFLPRLIATHKDWNAWVTEDIGRPATEPSTRLLMENAASTMATLQKRSVADVDDLLGAGCGDQRCHVLLSHLDELIDHLTELMDIQTSAKVPQLGRRQLQKIRATLHDACCRLQDLQIPDTVLHGDISAGNILYDGNRCRFIDWCEAYIGNPFITFQQICLVASARRASSSELRLRYGDIWRDVLSEHQIDEAFALTPIVAVFSHLYGRGTWLNSPLRDLPQLQGYRRSLARYMSRAAQDPDLREALCH